MKVTMRNFSNTRSAQRKRANRELVTARLDLESAHLYHNATPDYPRLHEIEQESFNLWFENRVSSDIEWLNDYCGEGPRHSRYVPPKYTTDAAKAYYLRYRRRQRAEQEDRTPYSRIADYGKVYQYGRGGRTLAPDGLVKSAGGGNSYLPRPYYFDERSYAERVEGVRVLSSFNRFVKDWCSRVPEDYAEHFQELVSEAWHNQLKLEVFDHVQQCSSATGEDAQEARVQGAQQLG